MLYITKHIQWCGAQWLTNISFMGQSLVQIQDFMWAKDLYLHILPSDMRLPGWSSDYSNCDQILRGRGGLPMRETNV